MSGSSLLEQNNTASKIKVRGASSGSNSEMEAQQIRSSIGSCEFVSVAFPPETRERKILSSMGSPELSRFIDPEFRCCLSLFPSYSSVFNSSPRFKVHEGQKVHRDVQTELGECEFTGRVWLTSDLSNARDFLTTAGCGLSVLRVKARGQKSQKPAISAVEIPCRRL